MNRISDVNILLTMDRSSTEYKKILKSLEHPDTLTSLRNVVIEKESSDVLKVRYAGHEVGGSYVYDWEVAPKYVEDLQYTTNRKVVWTKRTSGLIGYDYYHFDIHLNTIIDPNPYIPKGTIHRVANSYIAFDYEAGEEWALTHILYKALLNNTIPKSSGVTLRKDKKTGKDTIYFDNKKVIVVVEYEKETYVHIKGHGTDKNRKRTHAIYDILPKEYKKLYFNKYKDIVNSIVNDDRVKCKLPYIQYDDTYGNKLVVVFDNGYRRIYRSDWRVFTIEDKDDLILRLNHIFVDLKTYKGIWSHGITNDTLDLDTPISLQELVDMVAPKREYKEMDWNLGKPVTVRKHFYYAVLLNGEKNPDMNTILQNRDYVVLDYTGRTNQLGY